VGRFAEGVTLLNECVRVRSGGVPRSSPHVGWRSPIVWERSCRVTESERPVDPTARQVWHAWSLVPPSRCAVVGRCAGVDRAPRPVGSESSSGRLASVWMASDSASVVPTDRRVVHRCVHVGANCTEGKSLPREASRRQCIPTARTAKSSAGRLVFVGEESGEWSGGHGACASSSYVWRRPRQQTSGQEFGCAGSHCLGSGGHIDRDRSIFTTWRTAALSRRRSGATSSALDTSQRCRHGNAGRRMKCHRSLKRSHEWDDVSLGIGK
jgi:hypothetical protein